jgi:hypothetical protein
MIYLILLISVTFFSSCDQKPQVRQYTEVVAEFPKAAVPADMISDPHEGMGESMPDTLMATANVDIQNKLSWKVPEGWVEQPGNSMRLASFHLASDPKEIDVSIVSLGGMAGGLEANLKRWMGQIQIQVSDETLQAFIKSSEKNIFDLSELQPIDNLAAPSMIAAMIDAGDTTVFVKMTGTIEAVSKHKDAFVVLVESVHSK